MDPRRQGDLITIAFTAILFGIIVLVPLVVNGGWGR